MKNFNVIETIEQSLKDLSGKINKLFDIFEYDISNNENIIEIVARSYHAENIGYLFLEIKDGLNIIIKTGILNKETREIIITEEFNKDVRYFNSKKELKKYIEYLLINLKETMEKTLD